MKLDQTFEAKLKIVLPHILFILVVAPFDGNQYYTSATILGFHFILAIASAILVVVVTLYAAIYLPTYMQIMLLVCVIIFSMTAYIPRVTALIEETAVQELPNIRPYVEPDSNLRVTSKNELYLDTVAKSNKNIDWLNDLEKERVANLNLVRKTNATTKAISVGIMILVFGLLLPFALYIGAQKLADRLKFIETMEVRRAFTTLELKKLLIENSMSMENSMAQLHDELQAKIKKLEETTVNKNLVLATSPQDLKKREREIKTKAVLREIEAAVRTDTDFTYSGLAAKHKMDRETVKKIVVEASKTMPELRSKLDKLKTNS